MINCKHCSADRIDYKKIKILEINCMNEISNYQKYYFIINTVAAESAAQIIVLQRLHHNNYIY